MWDFGVTRGQRCASSVLCHKTFVSKASSNKSRIQNLQINHLVEESPSEPHTSMTALPPHCTAKEITMRSWGFNKHFPHRRKRLNLVSTLPTSKSGGFGFTYFSLLLAFLDEGTTHYTEEEEVRNCVVNFMYLIEMTDAVCRQEYHLCNNKSL